MKDLFGCLLSKKGYFSELDIQAAGCFEVLDLWLEEKTARVLGLTT